MTLKTTDDLIRAANAVASHDPVAWKRLVDALETHYCALADQTVDAVGESVHVAQGAARQARFLTDTFKTCREIASKLK